MIVNTIRIVLSENYRDNADQISLNYVIITLRGNVIFIDSNLTSYMNINLTLKRKLSY